MKLPDISEKKMHCVTEIPVGLGDYLLGGGKSLPFLSYDHQSTRRPLIAGEIVDDFTNYPALAASMFDGREKDLEDWAIMWKGLGMDALCIRLIKHSETNDVDSAVSIINKITDKTQLPIILHGCGNKEYDVPFLSEVSKQITQTRLIVSEDLNLENHISIYHEATIGEGVFEHASAPIGRGFGKIMNSCEGRRRAAISGDTISMMPTLFDATTAWNYQELSNNDEKGPAIYKLTWWECLMALNAMLAGTDIVILRNPAAADMVIGYAEDLRGE